MGGFTKIQLKDTSQENIDNQNENLKQYGVPKRYRFYSEDDIRKEWEFYRNDPDRHVHYPPHLFPQDLKSYDDFKKYWSSEAMGEVFVPPIGALTFDAYFGRTSKNAMHGIARWVLIHGETEGISTSGSYSTFVERSGYKAKTNQRRLLAFD